MTVQTRISAVIIVLAALFFSQCCTPLAADEGHDFVGAPLTQLRLDTLNLSLVQQDFGKAAAGKSVGGAPMSIGGTPYQSGIGTHANSVIALDLHGSAVSFSADAGVDGDVGRNGSVTFTVVVDGKSRFQSPLMRGGNKAVHVTVDLSGAKVMKLVVGDGGDGNTYDHADWANATLAVFSGHAPEIVASIPEAAEPARMSVPAPQFAPAIHGPRIVGATPGRPFLFLVPATGRGPLRYYATSLPAGLVLNTMTGVISGALTGPVRTDVSLTVVGATGETMRTLTIVGGNGQLALTPPMGWNSWNVWGAQVDADKVRAAADAMVDAGLAAHGYQYVNIDDTWQGERDTDGRIEANAKFPYMSILARYVHDKGLKIGIYSSPGPKTCAGYAGSYGHEDQDAQAYADWGIDYLKYDWCSYGQIAKDSLKSTLEFPYATMRTALDKTNRDIVYSMCQYGAGDVWTWGASVGGNAWRTTGDINDTWSTVHSIIESQNGHEKYAGPGHWNDPDMLVLGRVVFGSPHATNLTPNEQLSHISMWCMLAAPLLLGCDLSRLDGFTKAILTNDELIDVDQDPLGKPAGRVATIGGVEVWSRPLADGSRAVALFNPTVVAATGTVRWSDIGLSGPKSVRDLWLHTDIGELSESYTVDVPSHGVVVLKIGP